jgi:glycosyltransferase involved in cell wall biosynthesis
MGKPVYLRMAGAGPQLLEVKLRAKQLGLLDSCVFTGAYTEPLGRNVFMQSLDVFVLPTLAEGTPNSIIEAMAHGLPIIASAVGGIPDMISTDIGILIPPGDNAALAQALQQLTDDPCLRERMGHAAKARYQELFSPEAVLPLLAQTYRRVSYSQPLIPPVTDIMSTVHPWQTPA